MLPLQWIAWGLLLVVTDLTLGRWVVLVDPLGWLAVLHGVLLLRRSYAAPGAGCVLAGVVALAVSAVTWVPGLLPDLDPSLSWGLSLPEEVFCVLLALGLRDLLPERARTLQLLAWGHVVVAVTPPLVLVTESATLVVLLAGFAVIVSVWLLVVLFLAAKQLPPTPRPQPAGAR